MKADNAALIPPIPSLAVGQAEDGPVVYPANALDSRLRGD